MLIRDTILEWRPEYFPLALQETEKCLFENYLCDEPVILRLRVSNGGQNFYNDRERLGRKIYCCQITSIELWWIRSDWLYEYLGDSWYMNLPIIFMLDKRRKFCLSFWRCPPYGPIHFFRFEGEFWSPSSLVTILFQIPYKLRFYLWAWFVNFAHSSLRCREWRQTGRSKTGSNSNLETDATRPFVVPKHSVAFVNAGCIGPLSSWMCIDAT